MGRPRYIREHFAAVVAAVADDAPVTAYLHWSLVDNYEWGTYEPRFGLFGMDRDRQPGPYAGWIPMPPVMTAPVPSPTRQRPPARGSIGARRHR